MDVQMMTGNLAAAWGARLADVDYIPAFPITPQTEIVEALAKWCEGGELAARFVTMDSEHSMMTAAGAAEATGARVFTATSSQGLLYAFEVLYSISGWRAPLVLVNVSRALAAPITLESDHNDVLAARDSGFLQIHAETCQEVLDSILMAYRIAEDERVMLPVIVNLDGFSLSFTREPVSIPDAEQVRKFLPPFRPAHLGFRASVPHSLGVAVIGGTPYAYFRHQMHLASTNALEVHREVAASFEQLFGRRYDLVERYRLDDAEDVLVMTNSCSSTGKATLAGGCHPWRIAGASGCGGVGSESRAGAGWHSVSGNFRLAVSRSRAAAGTVLLHRRARGTESIGGRVSRDLRANGESRSQRKRNRSGSPLHSSRASGDDSAPDGSGRDTKS
mgnify:CR=1 FL=1